MSRLQGLQGLDPVPSPTPGPWACMLESPPGFLAAEGQQR